MPSNNPPTHFFKFLCSSVAIIILGLFLFLRGVKAKTDFHHSKGKITYLGKTFGKLPLRDARKYRYLKIENYPQVFEIFIGKDIGDFKPAYENIDSLKIGDTIDLFYAGNDRDTKTKAAETILEINATENTSVNSLLEYIDKDNIPFYITGQTDKILGRIIVYSGILLIIILFYFRRKGKIT
jgi:hypothetical protein